MHGARALILVVIHRMGRSIAGELIKQVEEDGELLRGGDYGAQITAANMMGPISERTAQAVRAALVDRERDARSFEGELQEAVSAITVVENGRASEVTELQTQQQQLVASFQVPFSVDGSVRVVVGAAAAAALIASFKIPSSLAVTPKP